jgi:hypothetical protein
VEEDIEDRNAMYCRSLPLSAFLTGGRECRSSSFGAAGLAMVDAGWYLPLGVGGLRRVAMFEDRGGNIRN